MLPCRSRQPWLATMHFHWVYDLHRFRDLAFWSPLGSANCCNGAAADCTRSVRKMRVPCADGLLASDAETVTLQVPLENWPSATNLLKVSNCPVGKPSEDVRDFGERAVRKEMARVV